MVAWLTIQDIIGLKVKCIRGHLSRKNQKTIEPQFILFSDGETFIELEEQDYYAYHDCSAAARELQIKRSANQWNMLMNNEHFADATEDL